MRLLIFAAALLAQDPVVVRITGVRPYSQLAERVEIATGPHGGRTVVAVRGGARFGVLLPDSAVAAAARELTGRLRAWRSGRCGGEDGAVPWRAEGPEGGIELACADRERDGCEDEGSGACARTPRQALLLSFFRNGRQSAMLMLPLRDERSDRLVAALVGASGGEARPRRQRSPGR